MLTKYGHRNPALVSCTERATWTVVPSRSTSLSCSASSSPHRRPVARSKSDDSFKRVALQLATHLPSGVSSRISISSALTMAAQTLRSGPPFRLPVLSSALCQSSIALGQSRCRAMVPRCEMICLRPIPRISCSLGRDVGGRWRDRVHSSFGWYLSQLRRCSATVILLCSTRVPLLGGGVETAGLRIYQRVQPLLDQCPGWKRIHAERWRPFETEGK